MTTTSLHLSLMPTTIGHHRRTSQTGKRLAPAGPRCAPPVPRPGTYAPGMGTPLGDFIRAKRDDTRPADLGLPALERRRAPGLRRSELAARAGISVEYLTRIEQGRDRNPSV